MEKGWVPQTCAGAHARRKTRKKDSFANGRMPHFLLLFVLAAKKPRENHADAVCAARSLSRIPSIQICMGSRHFARPAPLGLQTGNAALTPTKAPASALETSIRAVQVMAARRNILE
ncbi:hypothetical protein AAC387_Pa01g1374 [Persea americana]